MNRILSVISMMLGLAETAMAERHSLLSGEPTAGGSAFTENETWWAGFFLVLFIVFLWVAIWRMAIAFLRNGRI